MPHETFIPLLKQHVAVVKRLATNSEEESSIKAEVIRRDMSALQCCQRNVGDAVGAEETSRELLHMTRCAFGENDPRYIKVSDGLLHQACCTPFCLTLHKV